MASEVGVGSAAVHQLLRPLVVTSFVNVKLTYRLSYTKTVWHGFMLLHVATEWGKNVLCEMLFKLIAVVLEFGNSFFKVHRAKWRNDTDNENGDN